MTEDIEDDGFWKSRRRQVQGLVMEGVREYCEEMPVVINRTMEGRLVIEAKNEGGHNSTQVDLEDLLHWIEKNYAHAVRTFRGKEE